MLSRSGPVLHTLLKQLQYTLTSACLQATETAAHTAAINRAAAMHEELQLRLSQAEERAAQALQQRQADKASARRRFLQMQQEQQQVMHQHQ